MISNLNYDYLSGVEPISFYINTETTSDSQTEYLNLIIKHKYLRSYRSHITYDLTSLDLLKSISHLWNGHNLILNSSSLQPSPELFQLILTSSGWLELKFEVSLSFFNQQFLNQDPYQHISISDSSYDPNNEFLYSEIIADILSIPGSNGTVKN